VLCVVRTFLFL